MPSQHQTQPKKNSNAQLGKALQIMHHDSRKAITTAQQVLATAIANKQKDLEAQALCTLAKIYELINEPAEREKLFIRLGVLCPDIENETVRADIANAVGEYYGKKGDPVHAIEYLFTAKTLYEHTGASFNLASTLNAIVVVLRESGNYADALRYTQLAWQAQQQNDDKAVGIKILINNGILYNDTKEHHKAIECYTECIPLCKEYSDYLSMAWALENLALAHRNSGEYVKALQFYNESLALYQKHGTEIQTVPVSVAIGMLHVQQEQYKDAEVVLKGALSVAKKYNDSSAQASALIALGELLYKTQHYEQSLSFLLQTLELIERTKAKENQFTCHELLSLVYADMDMYKEAYQQKLIIEKLRDQTLYNERMKSLTAAEVEEVLYRLEKKQTELIQRMQYAEEIVEQKAQELQQVTATLQQSVKTLKLVEETIKPYMQQGEGEVKKLATSLYEGLSKTIKAQHINSSESYFDKSYQDFIQRVHTKYPQLTPTEIKVCVMIKLNYSNKQIGDLINISELTVKTHRARIRKKLLLSEQENLLNVLLRI